MNGECSCLGECRYSRSLRPPWKKRRTGMTHVLMFILEMCNVLCICVFLCNHLWTCSPHFLGGNWTLRARWHPWEGGNSWSQGMCCITDLNIRKQHPMRNVTNIYCPCRETVGLTGLQDLKGLRERKVKG